MELFNQGLTIVQRAILAFGMAWIVWGLVTLGKGFKDKTGPEIAQGFGTLIGGALICLGAALVTQIHMG